MDNKLKAKIVERYGTQADFAVKIGVDESVVSRVLRGRRYLTPEAGAKWARALGVPKDQLPVQEV